MALRCDELGLIEVGVDDEREPSSWLEWSSNYGSLVTAMFVVLGVAFGSFKTAGFGAGSFLIAPLVIQVLLRVMDLWIKDNVSLKINDKYLRFHSRVLTEGEAERIVKAFRNERA